ncbi:hypothetical protein [Mastigocladopsis repens]|uniref:hypothetical protein n=1 Tax=Mastigocladopsis repens TaxID=221287 RepID=UPI000312A8B6|nr:hypothetical protein [Mastigocladopsis repens]
MSKQQQADIKLAYQSAAEMTYMIAVGLSKAVENQKKEKSFAKRQKRLKSKQGATIEIHNS